MADLYEQVLADRDVNGKKIPLDSSSRYTIAAPTNIVFNGLVEVTDVDTGLMIERIAQDVFDNRYDLVSGN